LCKILINYNAITAKSVVKNYWQKTLDLTSTSSSWGINWLLCVFESYV
jgi:hypothetical protein